MSRNTSESMGSRSPSNMSPDFMDDDAFRFIMEEPNMIATTPLSPQFDPETLAGVAGVSGLAGGGPRQLDHATPGQNGPIFDRPGQPPSGGRISHGHGVPSAIVPHVRFPAPVPAPDGYEYGDHHLHHHHNQPGHHVQSHVPQLNGDLASPYAPFANWPQHQHQHQQDPGYALPPAAFDYHFNINPNAPYPSSNNLNARHQQQQLAFDHPWPSAADNSFARDSAKSASSWPLEDDEDPSSVAEEGDEQAQQSHRPNPTKRHKKAATTTAGSTSSAHTQETKTHSPNMAAATSSGPATKPHRRTSHHASTSVSGKSTNRKPAETTEERRTRYSHNIVEKEYRNRLNKQFQDLLAALPEELRATGVAGLANVRGITETPAPAPVEATERKVSKGEVLEMARWYIKSLESETRTLKEEREELRRKVRRSPGS